MTLHASKGLEFPIVYLAGCDEGIFPSQRTLNIKSELEEERRLMYVGITRAETKLYLTTAKRRQMWGEYKYYTPSRFIEEIPSNLLDVEESRESEFSPRSTFSNAVKSVRGGQNRFSSKENRAQSKSDSDGYVKPVTSFGANFGQSKSTSSGFGKDFVAPGREKYNTPKVTHTPKRMIVSKNPINKQKEDEKIKAFFENNIMKQKLEERKKEQARQAEDAEKEAEMKSAATQYYFNVGERVFHDKLGVGHITDVIQIGESTMYTIDFGKFGKKAMDATYAHLKKF
jgi:DNA helicase-2/ATP-dependent DNA helicase PcrA